MGQQNVNKGVYLWCHAVVVLSRLKSYFITVPVFCTSWTLISTTSSPLRASRDFENAASLREKKIQSTSVNQDSVQLRCRDPVMVGFENISQRALYIYLQNKYHAENGLNYAHRQTSLYTGCPRRNVPDFGRVFLILKYTDITQNTYVQSWTVTEIMAGEVWNFDSCYTHLLITKYILKLAGIYGFRNVNNCT